MAHDNIVVHLRSLYRFAVGHRGIVDELDDRVMYLKAQVLDLGVARDDAFPSLERADSEKNSRSADFPYHVRGHVRFPFVENVNPCRQMSTHRKSICA
jgi:hypothetical protein